MYVTLTISVLILITLSLLAFDAKDAQKLKKVYEKKPHGYVYSVPMHIGGRK